MSEPQWYAAAASSAPLVSHLLSTDTDPRGRRYARCRERRTEWRPVESFVQPEAFRQCGICQRRGEADPMTRRAEQDGLHEEITPDWHAIHEALEHNPAYQTACAEIDELDRQEPPREIDVKALFEELRAKRDAR